VKSKLTMTIDLTTTEKKGREEEERRKKRKKGAFRCPPIDTSTFAGGKFFSLIRSHWRHTLPERIRHTR
jgi:hypothetical protein